MLWRRWVYLACVLVLLSAAGCNLLPFVSTPTPATGRQRAATLVTVAAVRAGAIGSVLSYAGNVQPKHQVNVVPKAGGRVERINVDTGSNVRAGEVLAELDHVTLDAQVQQAEANVLNAQLRVDSMLAGGRPEDVAAGQAQVTSAQAKLDLARKGATSAELEAAEAAVVAGRAGISAAKQRLADLLAKPKLDTVRAAELQLQAARDALNAAYIDRDGICGNPRNPEYQCLAAKAKAGAAQGAVATAQNNLQLAKAAATPEELQAARDGVTSAEAALQGAESKLALLQTYPQVEDVVAAQAAVTQARNQLELKKKPYTERDIDGARAQVSQVEAALAVAKAQRSEANVVAPFDGVVSQRLLSEGAFASTTTPIVTLVSHDVEVVINVEESRIGLLQPGQPVSLTVSAYPGQNFPARVAAVAPTADTRSHTFAVKVAPVDQGGKLRGGMFCEVNVTAEQKEKAVLLPKEAVLLRGSKSVVFAVVDGLAAVREIATGLSDEQSVEALSGVQVGEMVVVRGQTTLNDGDRVQTATASPGGAGVKAAPTAGATPQSGLPLETKPGGARPGAKPAPTTPTPGESR